MMNNLKETQREWAKYAHNRAIEVGVPEPQYPTLFVAKLMQDSTFNPLSKSDDGKLGIAQLTPEDAAELRVDPQDPYAAIDASLARDVRNYGSLGGNLVMTIAASHAGIEPIKAAIDTDESIPSATQTYLNRVFTLHYPTFLEMFESSAQQAEGSLNQSVKTTQRVSRNVGDLRVDFSNGAFTKDNKKFLERMVNEYTTG